MKLAEMQERTVKAKTPEEMRQVIEELSNLPVTLDVQTGGLSVLSLVVGRMFDIVDAKINLLANELEKLKKEVCK